MVVQPLAQRRVQQSQRIMLAVNQQHLWDSRLHLIYCLAELRFRGCLLKLGEYIWGCPKLPGNPSNFLYDPPLLVLDNPSIVGERADPKALILGSAAAKEEIAIWTY